MFPPLSKNAHCWKSGQSTGYGFTSIPSFTTGPGAAGGAPGVGAGTGGGGGLASERKEDVADPAVNSVVSVVVVVGMGVTRVVVVVGTGGSVESLLGVVEGLLGVAEGLLGVAEGLLDDIVVWSSKTFRGSCAFCASRAFCAPCARVAVGTLRMLLQERFGVSL